MDIIDVKFPHIASFDIWSENELSLSVCVCVCEREREILDLGLVLLFFACHQYHNFYS